MRLQDLDRLPNLLTENSPEGRQFQANILSGVANEIHRDFHAKAHFGADQFGHHWDITAKAAKDGKPMLIRTHRLEQSLAPNPNPDQIATFSEGTIEFGTRVPYAKYVNAKRPLLPSARELAVIVAKIIPTAFRRTFP